MKLTPPNITPGPWQVSQTLGIGQTVTDSRENLIGFCDAARCDATENRTNAHAIAATPDTLAALADLLRIYDGQTTAQNGDELAPFIVDEVLAMEKARAALLKAGYKIEE